MTAIFRAATLAAAALLPLAATANLITFDGLTTGPSGYDNGSSLHGGFTDGGGFFQNVFTDFGGGFSAWSGFALSNLNAPSVPGFANQYSVYQPGTGRGGSGNYLIGFDNENDDLITLPAGQTVTGLFLNNTAYAALSLRDGDAFAKKFGGPSGNDPDFFKLVITGRDSGGSTTGSVDFFLADYRFADNTRDYIVSDWTFVDLTPLSPSTRSLGFTLSSTDNGTFGMNTPAYFALDDVQVVPEPSSGLLLLPGLAWLMRRRGTR